MTVGKLSLAATSLVAALPGAVMVYLGVMAFLGYAEKMPGMLKVVAGATVGVSALVALSPVAILIFGPKGATAPKKKAAADDDSESIGDETADDELIVEESVTEVEAFETDSEVDEFETGDEFETADDFADSTEMEIADEDAAFDDDVLADSSDDFEFESDDDFAFDDEDDERKA